jgi:hypothetical protein
MLSAWWQNCRLVCFASLHQSNVSKRSEQRTSTFARLLDEVELFFDNASQRSRSSKLPWFARGHSVMLDAPEPLTEILVQVAYIRTSAVMVLLGDALVEVPADCPVYLIAAAPRP